MGPPPSRNGTPFPGPMTSTASSKLASRSGADCFASLAETVVDYPSIPSACR